MSTSGGNLDLLKLTLNYLSTCILFCEQLFDFLISSRSDYGWEISKYFYLSKSKLCKFDVINVITGFSYVALSFESFISSNTHKKICISNINF